MSDYKKVVFVASIFDEETNESVTFKKDLLISPETSLKKLKNEADRFAVWVEEQY